jgi:hypothetical protein
MKHVAKRVCPGSFRNRLFLKKLRESLLLSVVLTFFCGAVLLLHAQDATQVTSGNISKFSYPDRDKDGNLIWLLNGDYAKIRPDGKMEITQLLLFTYKGTNVDWTMITPNCILDRPTREAVGEKDIHIFSEDTDIRGTGFHLLANESQFIIRNRVRVTLKSHILRSEKS